VAADGATTSIVDRQGVAKILAAAPFYWFFANILGKMSSVPAGLTAKENAHFQR